MVKNSADVSVSLKDPQIIYVADRTQYYVNLKANRFIYIKGRVNSWNLE